MESPDQSRYQPEHQPVDHQKEEPEGQHGERQGEKNEDGTDERIDHSEKKGSDQSSAETVYTDHLRKKIGDDQDGKYIDDEAGNQAYHFNSIYLFLFQVYALLSYQVNVL